MSKKSRSKLWFLVHSWLALPIWFFVLIVCVTGTLAVVSQEIVWLANPQMRASPPSDDAPRLSYDEILAAIKTAEPQTLVQSISRPDESHFALDVEVSYPDGRSLTVYVNPYTGVIQGTAPSFDFKAFTRALHGWWLVPFTNGYSWGWYLVSFLARGYVGRHQRLVRPPKEQGDPSPSGGRATGPRAVRSVRAVPPTASTSPTPRTCTSTSSRCRTLRVLPIVVQLYSPAKTNNSPDSNDSTTITTTFTLKSPDSTPFDDTDNPLTTCTGSGQSNPRLRARTRSTTTTPCWAPRAGPGSAPSRPALPPATTSSGSRRCRVRRARTGPTATGSWRRTAASASSATSARDLTCPTVVGRNWISVLAASSSSAADFYLAEIDAEHAGKQMEITLFDPGEGGNYIQIRDPNGTPSASITTRRQRLHRAPASTSLDVSGCTGFPRWVRPRVAVPASTNASS